MNNKANVPFYRTLTRFGASCLVLVTCAGMFIPAAGRTLAANNPSAEQSSNAAPNSSAGELSTSVVRSEQSSIDSKPAKPDIQSLTGRDGAAVEAALGKPKGQLQTAQGALWLYAEWRVHFDRQSKVLKIEQDQPVRLAKLDPQFVATADAIARGAAQRAADEDAARAKTAALQAAKIKIISNGGQEVDLPSVLAEGKITIVDFYAEWCGPCRQLSPRLEQLASSDPDVVLVKIDIANWNTPITRQFDIGSIPNVRVFSRTKTQVGEATPDVNRVLQSVRQAKGV